MRKISLALALLILYGQAGAQQTTTGAAQPRQTNPGNTPAQPAGQNAAPGASPSSLTLEECYRLARQNYPLIRQRELILHTREYSVENVSRGWLPQVSFSGQATYQSQTISFPFNIPGTKLPEFSKDQYRLQAEIDQTLYDGGAIGQQKDLRRAEEGIQEKNLEVILYALKDRVNQLFFGILLINAQLEQNELQRADLQSGADKTQASVNNGTAFRSSLDELKAEIFGTQQNRTQLLASLNAYTKMLSLFIGRALDGGTTLVSPPQETAASEITRPELALFDFQKKTFDIQERQLRTSYRPKVSAFAQGAYGRPTLNFISNDFGFWALGGIRFSWSLSGLYTSKNDRRLLEIHRNDLDIQKETFLFNTRLSLSQQQTEVNKYQALIDQDQQIVALRASVKQASGAQLENGVITSHDYINQVNAESQARQGLILHQIQLLQSEYNTRTISGD